MNEKNYNEDIEILDGLEDLFDETPSKKEEEPKPAHVKPEEEEVFSVFDEPNEEPVFTAFTPDSLEEEPETEVTPGIEDINSEEEKDTPEIFTVGDQMNPIEEDNHQESSIEESFEPEETFSMEEELSSPSLSEEPVAFAPFEDTMVEPEIKEDIEIGPSSLEPVEIQPEIQENLPEESEKFDFDSDLEETQVQEPVVEDVPSVPEDLNFNYNFVEDFSNGEHQTIDDAFQFEPTVEDIPEPQMELEMDDDSDGSLGKTVIIEPVVPKEVEDLNEEPIANVENTSSTNLPVVEETKMVPVGEVKDNKIGERKKKKKEEKSNTRTVLFVVLLIILLLAFAALVPMLLEKFAV